jgi:maltooligosyltrehalose synthase
MVPIGKRKGGDKMNGVEGLTKIAEGTNNDILLLFIVIAIVVILIAVPTFRIYSKNEAERRTQDIKREENILNVIRENTTVNSSIKTLLETSVRGCDSCKQEQLQRFMNIELGINTLLERGKNNGATHI